MLILRAIIRLLPLFAVCCSYRYQGDILLPEIPRGSLPGSPKDVAPVKSDLGAMKPKKIQRLVIGVGSGLYGFCTVDLNNDGGAEVIFDDSEMKGKYIKATARSSLACVVALLDSNVIKNSIDLDRRYSKPINDGTQAFLYVSDGTRSSFTFCNNTFPTKFRAIWHDVTALIERQPSKSWHFVKNADAFRTYQLVKP